MSTAARDPDTPAPAPPGFVDGGRTSEIPPSVEPASPAPRWDNRPRYSDLLSSRTPVQRTEPALAEVAPVVDPGEVRGQGSDAEVLVARESACGHDCGRCSTRSSPPPPPP